MKIDVCKEVSVETAAKLIGMSPPQLRLRLRDGIYGRSFERKGNRYRSYIITVGSLARDLAVPEEEVGRRINEIESQI